MHLSVVGRPVDGAGDEVKVGTSELLYEAYFPIFEQATTSPDPSKPQISGRRLLHQVERTQFRCATTSDFDPKADISLWLAVVSHFTQTLPGGRCSRIREVGADNFCDLGCVFGDLDRLTVCIRVEMDHESILGTHDVRVLGPRDWQSYRVRPRCCWHEERKLPCPILKEPKSRRPCSCERGPM